MRPDTARFKITFSDHVSLEDVEEFVATGFGGFGDVTRSDEAPRTIFLTGVRWPYSLEIVKAQLSALQGDGLLKWENWQ
jgi:hypothetical protein